MFFCPEKPAADFVSAVTFFETSAVFMFFPFSAENTSTYLQSISSKINLHVLYVLAVLSPLFRNTFAVCE